MKKFTVAALVVASLLSVAPAIAQDASSGQNASQNEKGIPDFASLDADKTGELSYIEVTSAIPMSQAEFDALDTDKSGGLNLSEYSALKVVSLGSLNSSGKSTSSSAP